MKKLLLAVGVMVLTSCQKENMMTATETLPAQQNETNDLSGDEQRFLEYLRAHRIAQIEERDEVVNFNPENLYESMGSYLHEMLLAVKESEAVNPSADRSSLVARFADYQSAHPCNVLQNPALSGALPEALITLMKDEFLKADSKELAIANILLIEDAILETNLLPASGKEALLGFAAVMRYLRADMELLMEMIDTVSPQPAGVSTWGDCWEEHYSQRLNDSLNSWEESPTSTFLNWLGLPGTMVSSAIDAAWDCR